MLPDSQCFKSSLTRAKLHRPVLRAWQGEVSNKAAMLARHLLAAMSCTARAQVSLSSSVAHENMVQLLDVFAEGTELIIVVSHTQMPCARRPSALTCWWAVAVSGSACTVITSRLFDVAWTAAGEKQLTHTDSHGPQTATPAARLLCCLPLPEMCSGS